MTLRLLFCLFLSIPCTAATKYAVLISADAEWSVVKEFYPDSKPAQSPWGDYFFRTLSGYDVLFFHEGWGKIAAAGATQYVIDRYHPQVLINLGTCGGFSGSISKGQTVLADRTIIYDIVEAMGDSEEAIQSYTTRIDLSWLGDKLPTDIIRSTLVSADRDLRPADVEELKKKYGAVAGDWESGAIAYTAARNQTKLVILRSVTDLVTTQSGEAYGNLAYFQSQTRTVMTALLSGLPRWIEYLDKRLP